MKPHSDGPLIGGLLALLMSVLLILAYANQDSAYALILIALIAMVTVGPLALANLVITVVYLRRANVAGRTYALMWLPPLLVLSAPLVIEGVREQRVEGVFHGNGTTDELDELDEVRMVR